VPGLDLLTHAVWAPLVSALTTALPGFFSPAMPPAFHANYSALAAFFSRLRVFAAGREVLLPAPAADAAPSAGWVSVPASHALAAHSSTRSLEALWAPKLRIYYQLRSQELLARADKALVARVGTPDLAAGAPISLPAAELFRSLGLGPAPSAVPAVFTFYLPATAGVWSVLQSVWGGGTFLPPLASSFVGLALQTLTRYAAWTAAGVGGAAARLGVQPVLQAAAAAGASAASTAGALPPLPAPARAAMRAAVAAAGGGSTAAPPPPLAAAAAAAAADAAAWVDAGAEAFLAAAHDAAELAALVRLVLLPRALAALGLPAAPSSAVPPAGAGDASGAAATTLAAVLNAAAAEVAAVGPYCLAAARAALTASCAQALASVRAVPATFRMTSKAAPRHASPYVASLLRPLRACVLEVPGLLPPLSASPDVRALVAGVAEDVTAAFDSTVTGALAGLQQMEASLQWLKKPAAGPGGSGAVAGGGGGPVSDADKIGLQLYLDVRAYGGELAGLGLSIGGGSGSAGGALGAEVPSYVGLTARVAQYAALAV
jgi:hypothetical protein